MPARSIHPGAPGAAPSRVDALADASNLMLGPGRRYWKDWVVEKGLLLAALSSVAVTTGIVLILLYESVPFFRKVSLWSFLTDTMWTPNFPVNPHFGILPLVAGTVVTTTVALAVALPVGTMIAIYL